MTEKRYSSDMRFEKVKHEKFLKSDQFELASKGLAARRLLSPQFTLNLRVGARWEVKLKVRESSPFAEIHYLTSVRRRYGTGMVRHFTLDYWWRGNNSFNFPSRRRGIGVAE